MASRDDGTDVRHDERVAAAAQRAEPGTVHTGHEPRSAQGIAALIWTLTLAALGTGLGFHLANRGSPATIGVTDWWAMPLVSGVSFAGTGVWLVRVRPRLAIGWLSLGIGGINAVMLASLEYGVWALDQPRGTPGGAMALWLGNWVWLTNLLLIATVLPLLLPDGRLVSKRWQAALALSVAAVVTQSLTWAAAPYESWSPELKAAGAVNPIGTGWISADAVQLPLNIVMVAAVVVAGGSLLVRWRRSASLERQQLKWILLGMALTFLLFAAGFPLGPVFTALAMVPLPAACLVAALRYRLWDVDVVVSRSLLYGGLSAAVVVLYIACVGLLGGVLGRTTGAPLIATAVVAVCAEPAHRRLRTLVNRLVYGEPEDPFTVLVRAGQRLASARDGASVADEVLPEIVASVAAALRLPYVAVTLADGATIEHGCPGDLEEQTPLTYGGQQVGQLRYSPRTGGLASNDRRLLADLARHAAVAAHTVVLTRDLARSHEQLVTAREEERRRLHRELHDGLGPTLAALALQVETARDLTSTDPPVARMLLDRATPSLRSTVDQVRTLVRGLRPPPVDDLGLNAALRELGESFSAPGFAVSVQAEHMAALPAATEAAAYRIAAEALTNAARHSGATSVSINIEQRNSAIRLSVQDDGRGYQQHQQLCTDGMGIASMRERARELNGSFTIRTPANGRGTRVEATLPVAQP